MTAEADVVYFDLPDVFVPVDLGADPEDRVRSLLARSPSLSVDEQWRLAISQEVFVESLRQARVGYAATCLARVDDVVPRMSIAQFTIAVHDVPRAGRVALESMATRLGAPGPRRDVGFVELPAGRALAVVEERRFRSERNAFGFARSGEHVVHQIQLMFMFPGHRNLAVLTLSTESVRDTDVYVDLMGRIGWSVSFTPPERWIVSSAAGAISAALDGGRS